MAIPDDLVTTPSSRVKVEKGWGYEDWIYNGDLYCGKILKFEKGRKCSFHYHAIKDEVLYTHSGQILMKYAEDDDFENAKSVYLWPGMAFHVTPGLRHQMIAIDESLMYEFSTHHEDSDSYRVIKGD